MGYNTQVIYLFHGSDTNKVRAKAFSWVVAARAKAPDAYYFRLEAEEITPGALREALATQGLFFAKTLILLDDPFSESEAGEAVLGLLPELAASPNPVAILAPKLLAARVKKIEAQEGVKTFQIDATEKKPLRGFNTALVNALAAKDGTVLWKEIQLARREGDVPEMIHGLLHWKARDLMQKGGRVWTPAQARKLSMDLISLVSSARSGDLELGMALERFALSLSFK